MSRLEDQSPASPAAEDKHRPPTRFQRSLRRAGLAARRCWQAAGALPVVGGFLLLLLPFIVLLALTADLLAFLFGGVVRATISWTAIFVVLGFILGLLVGGEAMTVMPLMMGVAGFLLGLVLGFLCGPIFQSLPEHFDRDLPAG
jgi:hypothetical protein